jgi:HD domain
MEALLRGRLTSILALVAASAVLPAAILHFFGHREVYVEGWIHFAFIAIGASIAGAAAIALTIVGARRNDGRTVLLGTAFSVMTAMLTIHGLATPDIIVGQNGVIAFSGAAVLPVGGAVLALSALPVLRRPANVRPLLIFQAVLLTAVVAHTRRVAMRAVQVGEKLGLSGGRLRHLAIGGPLHDIGKLSVPTAILHKPGPLTDDEYAVIRRHPEAGARLIDELGGFAPQVRELVLGHHERLDGSGYPHGIGGDQLSLEVRILAACDVYDALISKRVYRRAWSDWQALELLTAESRTSFHPACVEALKQVLADEDPTTAAAEAGDTLTQPLRARAARAAI